jgi:hypothetical protein
VTTSLRRWLAAALALGAVAAWCACRHVEPGFVRTNVSLDLDHPERWVVDPAAVAPGTLGKLLWDGRKPLEARFGPVAPGDTLKVKLRLDPHVGPRPVTVSLDGRGIARIEIDDTWRERDVRTPVGGRVLRLELAGGPPADVHVSRVSATNVLAFSEGVLNAYVLPANTPPAEPPPGPVLWLLVLATPLILALLVVWRRQTGVVDWDTALRGAALELLPGVTVLAAAELSRLVGGPRLVCRPGTFLLLVAAPPLLAEIVRLRHSAARALIASARRLTGLPGAERRSDGRATVWLASVSRRHGLDRLTAAAVEQHGLSSRDFRRAFLVHVAIVAVLGAGLATYVVHDFRGPMLGNGDLAIWTYQGYYLGHNLSFTPLPRLDLVNDQLFYPYGGSNVFQAWVFEPALLSALADRAVGPGPWYQIYFLLSVLIAALGAFLLLVREHGAYRASLVAIAVSFCSYYAIGKFAGHFGVACTDWLTLNLLADWVMMRRFVVGRPWSARLLALRALLLMLVLGGDLSYMAGIALTSFSLCALTVVLAVVMRARLRPTTLARQARGWLHKLGDSLRAYPVQTSLLSGATLAVGFLWVPLVLQVSHAARAFDLLDMPTGGGWANPLRMLFPVFPGLNPVTLMYAFKDHPEARFAVSPGIFFVLFATAGIIGGRRRMLAWLPFVVLLAMFLSFDPDRFAVLRWLPWFPTVRLSGRFSTAYPTILAILGLNLPATAFCGRRRGVLAGAGVLLLAVEASTAYGVALITPHTFYRPDPAFTKLTGAIRAAPGEALLDWPFCLAGGNGVGTAALCPFYTYEAGNTMLLQPFEGKKVVAAYFGRLHPAQIKPYLEAGWPRLFLPDRADAHQATRQRRDFLPKEWEFLRRFFVLNDFCGILLYTDRLPAATVEGFHDRFGEPVAVAQHTPYGRLEFIPKQPEWRALVDREAGLELTLPFVPPPLPDGPLQMGDPAASGYLRSGWGHYEKTCRSSEGHVAEIAFSLRRIEPLRLTMMANTFQREHVRVLLNGHLLEEVTHDGRRFVIHTVVLPVSLLKEENVVRFELPDAHTPKSAGINDDTRVLGLTLHWLEIAPVQPTTEQPASAGARRIERRPS